MSTILKKINRRKNADLIIKWAESEDLDLDAYEYEELIEEFNDCHRGNYKNIEELVKEDLEEQDIPDYVEIDMTKTVAKIKTKFNIIAIDNGVAVFEI